MWTCQRRFSGVKCGHVNGGRKKKCARCGALKPRRRRPAHLRVLREMSYEEFVELNGGEFCGICGRPPKDGGRRLDRDHWHRGEHKGAPRGLLCWYCNTLLPDRVDAEWLRRAAAYLERSIAR